MIRPLLEMLRLRSGPQDLPAGVQLAVILAIAYLGQGLAADRIMEPSDTQPRSLVAIALQFGVIAALLQLRRLAERIPQTISALAGTGFLIGVPAILLLRQLTPGEPQPGLAIAYLGLFFWSMAVDAHIYRHALSVNMSMGILVAVLVFGLNFFLLRATFG